MFHWICPECGREIPPQVKECPACDVHANATAPAPQSLESAPAAVLQEPAAVVPEPAPTVAEPAALDAEPAAVVAEPAAAVPEIAAVVDEPAALDTEPAAVVAESTPVAEEPLVVPQETLAVAQEALAQETLVLDQEPPADDHEPPALTQEPVAIAEESTIQETAAPALEPPVALQEPIVEQSVAAEPDAGEPLSEEAAVEEPVGVLAESAAVHPEEGPEREEAAGVQEEAAEVQEKAPEAPEPVLESAPVSEATPEAPSPALPQEPALDPLLRLAQKLRETQRELELAAAAAAPVPAAEASLPEPEPEQAAPVETPVARAAPALLLEGAPAAVALLAPVEAPAELNPEAPQPEPNPEPEPEPVAIPASAGRVATPEPAFPASTPLPKLAELQHFPAPPPPPPQIAVVTIPSPAALGLGALQDSSAIGGRIRPAEQPAQILKSDASPNITLPGPALPRALNSLQDAGISKILTDRPKTEKKSSWGWLTGLLAAIVVMSCLVGFEMYTATHETAASHTPAHVEAPVTAEAAPIPSEPASQASYPLSKSVEVTGLRIVGDNATELRYLVVNHSSADLGAVTIYVTVRNSAAKPGQPPLSRFSFRAPSLGPFESKEMAATLDKPLHSGDWQGLHADVELGQ